MGGALRHQAVTTATTTSKPVPSEVRSILGASSSSNLAGMIGMVEILYDWYGRVEVQSVGMVEYGLLWFAAAWWWRAHVFLVQILRPILCQALQLNACARHL